MEQETWVLVQTLCYITQGASFPFLDSYMKRKELKILPILRGTASVVGPPWSRSRVTVLALGATLVDCQRPPLAEASATLQAGKRLLPSVQELVLSQVAPLGKALRAKVTGIGPLA